MKFTSKFWPLDYDTEDEIYENLSWDLPGVRRKPRIAARQSQQTPDLRRTRG